MKFRQELERTIGAETFRAINRTYRREVHHGFKFRSCLGVGMQQNVRVMNTYCSLGLQDSGTMSN